MKAPAGYRFQKKYAAFLLVVPLLLATAIVDIDCPVCSGRGTVSNNVSMENVKITHVEATKLGVLQHTCGMFLMYSYNVKLSIENSGPDDAAGWIMLYLIDYGVGKRLDIQYKVVEITGNTSWEVSYGVWFIIGTDQPQKTEVMADVFTGKVPCKSCGGSGRVSINVWPVVRSLEDRFIQLDQITKPWSVPEWPVDLESGPVDMVTPPINME